MLTFLTPLVLLQNPPMPPGTPRRDRRYRWGNANRAAVVVNGDTVSRRALIRDNRVQVPMRPIFEALGASVRWFPENRKVVARKGDKIVSLVLNESFAYSPNPVRLDYPPRMVGGVVYVPLRFVAQTLGAQVRFDRRRKAAIVEMSMRGERR